MKRNKAIKENSNGLILLAAICSLAVLVCLLLYHFDNKYTASGPKALNGVLTLSGQTLEEYPAIFLIDGWEYYSGRLLTPEDFETNPPLPDQYIFIGKYGGFEAGDSSASPHGSASYRLNIKIPDQPQTYMLELPEIFSAYRLYLNGKPAAVMGDPDPQNYRPETGNRMVTIEAQTNIEIIVAVSDFSHLYSGMVYPPAFGAPEAVSTLLYNRFLFRSALCVAALTIGLLSVLIGLLSRKSALAVLYGALCLFFVGYACYPITQTVMTGTRLLYSIENFSFCAMLFIVMLLQRKVCGLKDKPSKIFLLFGGLVCLTSAALPLLLKSGSLTLMLGFSSLISAYEWITAGFITFTGIRAVLNNTVGSKPILYGILIFDCALVMDRLLPLHEPILTGWFPELFSFALVLSIGVAVGQEVATQYRDKARLEERANSMERLSTIQQAYYSVLQQEMEETKKTRHDMRHHFMMIDGFLKDRQYDQLGAYVADYYTAFQKAEPNNYSPNNVINVMARHYDQLSEQNRIYFEIRCDVDSQLKMSDADLCCLLSNLLENAVEACLRIKTGRRFIRVGVARASDTDLAIRVQNSTDGNVLQDGDSFFSSKSEGRKGYGLESVKTIAERYDGIVQLSWDRAERVFTSIITLAVL